MKRIHAEKHYINRSGWLRASILGANDGILSTASIIIGVAAASDFRDPIVLAGVAGLVAGALSMAAGEYVSVSSQTDIEKSDLEREKTELKETPEFEFVEWNCANGTASGLRRRRAGPVGRATSARH